MGISPESITKLKTDYEAKIEKLPGPAKSAAKTAWNRIIDAVLISLTAQLLKTKQLKAMDTISLTAAVGALQSAGALVKKYSEQIKVPTKKMVSSSNSSETAELTQTLETTGANNSAAERIASNNQSRAAANTKRVDQSIQNVESNIQSLEKLKF